MKLRSARLSVSLQMRWTRKSSSRSSRSSGPTGRSRCHSSTGWQGCLGTPMGQVPTPRC
uniref:Uncharacterized protein n=1 Tax=Arundo donax TaxID=35708 RepID=A0A0A9GZ90_ARUDO